MPAPKPPTLYLSSRARGARTRFSITGSFSDETMLELRRRLLSVLVLWTTRQPVHVVVSADAAASSSWFDGWVEALEGVQTPLSVRFKLRCDHAGGRDED